MKLLIFKNLAAHRDSNKLTSIIYSLTLGSIIFIIVAANLQFQIFTSQYRYGEINEQISSAASGINDPQWMASESDPVLKAYSKYIDSHSYRTHSASYSSDYKKPTKAATISEPLA